MKESPAICPAFVAACLQQGCGMVTASLMVFSNAELDAHAGELRLFNSRTGKVLAYSGSENCCPRLDLPVSWRESWQSYTPEEQSAIEAAFKDTLQRRIRAAITVMGIGPAAAR
jgi:hypothetical protein